MSSFQCSVQSALQSLRTALEEVHSALACLPDVLPQTAVADVEELIHIFDDLVRAGTAGTIMTAHRGEEIEAYVASGHRNAADWLAQRSGTPFARAQDALKMVERLQKSAPVQEAFQRGLLSLPQALTVADAVDVVPDCGPQLLDAQREGSHRDLSRQADRIKQMARSREQEQSRRARAYRRRSLRYTQLPEGGVRVQLYVTEEAWARCLPVIDQRADVLFRRARSAAVQATRDQHRLDALVDLVSGRAAQEDGAASTRSTVTTIVRINVETLRRGSLASGEVCEIAGVGPVSVQAAEELLGAGWFRLLVTDGADVATITGRHRTVPARVEAALLERDQHCVVPGCEVDIGLQTHHWRTDVRAFGPTQFDNLCRICAIHHDLITNGGWKLTGGPGHWEWMAPDWPVSSTLRKHRRRVNARRGRSGA
ncbi:MAG TPA: hypothetical protein VG298_08850 [Acidimicrobiales bacterium]|nr:hypothetical protein [Acidimicrobiales bacterium]